MRTARRPTAAPRRGASPARPTRTSRRGRRRPVRGASSARRAAGRQVGAVGERFGPPRHRRLGELPDLVRHDGEQRRARPRLHDLDEHLVRRRAAVRRGRAADDVAAGGGDREPGRRGTPRRRTSSTSTVAGSAPSRSATMQVSVASSTSAGPRALRSCMRRSREGDEKVDFTTSRRKATWSSTFARRRSTISRRDASSCSGRQPAASTRSAASRSPMKARNVVGTSMSCSGREVTRIASPGRTSPPVTTAR